MPSPATRLYSTPEYRLGYEAGCKAARSGGRIENPFLVQDLRCLGWADACYDSWSARRVELYRLSAYREDFHPGAAARAFVS